MSRRGGKRKRWRASFEFNQRDATRAGLTGQSQRTWHSKDARFFFTEITSFEFGSLPATPHPVLDCHSLCNGLQGPGLTRGSHLGQEQEEEGGGIHLEVAPLVIAHHGAAGGGVVLGVQAVFGTLSVLELLHFIHLRERAGRLHMGKGLMAGTGLTRGPFLGPRPLSRYLQEPERWRAAQVP